MTPPGRHARVVAPELVDPTGHEAGCITCADTATRMRVLEVQQQRELALCVDGLQRRRMVDTGIVGAVAAGDTLLVHAGTALAREPV